jgi:hypothetical protein
LWEKNKTFVTSRQLTSTNDMIFTQKLTYFWKIPFDKRLHKYALILCFRRPLRTPELLYTIILDLLLTCVSRYAGEFPLSFHLGKHTFTYFAFHPFTKYDTSEFLDSSTEKNNYFLYLTLYYFPSFIQV